MSNNNVASWPCIPCMSTPLGSRNHTWQPAFPCNSRTLPTSTSSRSHSPRHIFSIATPHHTSALSHATLTVRLQQVCKLTIPQLQNPQTTLHFTTMLLHRALLTRATATTLCPGFISSSKARSLNLEPATRLAFRSTFHFGKGDSLGGVSTSRKMRKQAMAGVAASTDLEAFGKGKSGAGSPSKERGDCPFSQRIYIELEEKKLPYTATYIEEGDNKPDWFLKKNPKGLMPVLRDGEEWIQDSDKIAEYLEKKFPEVPLATPQEFKQVGLNVFQAFTSYLKSKNADDQSKEELLKELAALNDHLKTKGPYIAGQNPTDSDYALIPKLHHLRVSLAHYMNFKIPADFTALHKYIELLESRPSFQKTNSPDGMIIEGWQKKFGLPDRVVDSAAV